VANPSKDQYTNQTATPPPSVWVWKRPDGYWEVVFSKPQGIDATEYRRVNS